MLAQWESGAAGNCGVINGAREKSTGYYAFPVTLSKWRGILSRVFFVGSFFIAPNYSE